MRSLPLLGQQKNWWTDTHRTHRLLPWPLGACSLPWPGAREVTRGIRAQVCSKPPAHQVSHGYRTPHTLPSVYTSWPGRALPQLTERLGPRACPWDTSFAWTAFPATAHARMRRTIGVLRGLFFLLIKKSLLSRLDCTFSQSSCFMGAGSGSALWS